MTPLHYAASNGQLECARLLLERGADKEAKEDVRTLYARHCCGALRRRAARLALRWSRPSLFRAKSRAVSASAARAPLRRRAFAPWFGARRRARGVSRRVAARGGPASAWAALLLRRTALRAPRRRRAPRLLMRLIIYISRRVCEYDRR
jgi:hypothetical protein